MNKLQSELHRLYLPLIGSSGTVRAMVMELTRAPSWELLGNVWRGVQAELELPAPAIAVSGTDGLQLWFSLAEPVAVAQAQAFLERLRQRFLPDVDASRVRLMAAGEARPVPALQQPSGNWSAFLAPDLAPVFGDTPWLDIPPGDEGQAALLRSIEPMPRAAFEAAMDRLGPATAPVEASVTATACADKASTPALAAAEDDPRRFLLRVMHDETVALALRIEAAKALLLQSGA